MKILIFWDVYGRLWRKALQLELPKLKEIYKPDFVVVNIENITSWKGPIDTHVRFIRDLWVDVMTWWDHIFDQWEQIQSSLCDPKCHLIRPANFYTHESLSGTWYIIVEKNNKRLLVIQLIGEIFMNHKVQNPFLYIDELLNNIPRENYDACIIDFHRETTSEIAGMAYFLDGKISGIYGTHTHVQTSDAHILPKWTWMISDVGMNGPHYSVIWASFDSVKTRFLSGVSRWKILQELSWAYRVSAVVMDIDDITGLCKDIQSIFYFV